MLIIRDTSTVPNGGWRYPGINGYVIVTRNYSIFYDEIVAHYTANREVPPSREEVTRYACENLGVPCFEGEIALASAWMTGNGQPRKPCGSPCK